MRLLATPGLDGVQKREFDSCPQFHGGIVSGASLTMKDENELYEFPTTRWTLVMRAGDENSEIRRTALGELCSIYWRPLYSFARYKGKSVSDAEDLTQGFLSQCIERGNFGNLVPEGSGNRAKLRSFLMKTFSNFIVSDWRKENSQKRGAEFNLQSIDIERAEKQLTDSAGTKFEPDHLYDRVWAISLLDSVLEQMEQRYRKLGKADLYFELKPGLTFADSLADYDVIADRLNISVANVKTSVHRLRKEFGKELRSAVADTLIEGADVDEEVRYLMEIILKTQ